MAVTIEDLITEAIKPLQGKTPDEIVDIIKGSVGKAYCRNAEKCAIAQFVFDQLPTGYAVEVDGDAVTVYELDETGTIREQLVKTSYGEDYEPVQGRVDLPDEVRDFIRNFDDLKYPELVHTSEEGVVLRDETGEPIQTLIWDDAQRYGEWEPLRLPVTA